MTGRLAGDGSMRDTASGRTALNETVALADGRSQLLTAWSIAPDSRISQGSKDPSDSRPASAVGICCSDPVKSQEPA